MIGMIVSGHGEFAPGLTNAMEMIAGKQDAFLAIPFKEGQDLKMFEAEMLKAAQDLAATAEGVVFFTDLLGGTPFRTAMLASAQVANSAVVVGTNLPMLIEIALSRAAYTEAQEMAEAAKSAALDSIDVPALPGRDSAQDDDGDGI